jgi:hypothetical protein
MAGTAPQSILHPQEAAEREAATLLRIVRLTCIVLFVTVSCWRSSTSIRAVAGLDCRGRACPQDRLGCGRGGECGPGGGRDHHRRPDKPEEDRDALHESSSA